MDFKQLNELLELALDDLAPEEIVLVNAEPEQEFNKEENDYNDKLAIMINKSISEEELAIAEYEKRALECKEKGNEEMAKMFQELADDEKVHSAQLRKTLDLLGLNNEQKEQEGEKEAEEILGVEDIIEI